MRGGRSGWFRLSYRQYESALRDFNEAIRLNPGFALA
jgi:hypothetical protein